MLTNLLSNPQEAIIDLLISLPGILLALSVHESAHALVALLCGDETAYYQGRISLNPLRHIDPIGFVCMMLFHFGWAKPVPVNPLRLRHMRRDDMLVSLAGITANLIMFVLGTIIMYIPLTMLLRNYNMQIIDCTYFFQTAYGYAEIYLEEFGEIPYYLFRMLLTFTTVNLSLAIFNLLPIPPLDGYHVLNDTILHNTNLFVKQRIAQIGMILVFVLLAVPQISDVYSRAVGQLMTWLFDGLGFAAYHLIHLVGLV